jgi:excisionase family DNA binding protein
MHSSVKETRPARRVGRRANPNSTTETSMNAELVPLAFTVPQVAAVLGVPLRDAGNLVEDGVIRSIAIGVRRIVPRDELLRFLEANLVPRTS